MASSTLGVLDVLSRLREESERASTALKAQEDTNRGLLERCIEAEAESGRSDGIREALHRQKRQLEEGRRVAETRRKEAEGRLGRLNKKKKAHEEAAARARKATIAAARSAVDSSKNFRADASESVRQIGELRARLREKNSELKSGLLENKQLQDEMDSKIATRDKLKGEVSSRQKAVAAARSKIDDADRENRSKLTRVKHVEGEIDEIRQAQDEMQEMAVGLQRKNAILRNELRHLKREVDGASAGNARKKSSRERTTDRGDGTAMQRGGNSSTTAAPFQAQPSPYQPGIRRTAASPSRTPTTTPSSTTNNKKLKGPFLTAASVMGMPELRLSSPHPGGRTASSQGKSALPSSVSVHGRSRKRAWGIQPASDSAGYGSDEVALGEGGRAL